MNDKNKNEAQATRIIRFINYISISPIVITCIGFAIVMMLGRDTEAFLKFMTSHFNPVLIFGMISYTITAAILFVIEKMEGKEKEEKIDKENKEEESTEIIEEISTSCEENLAEESPAANE